MEKLKRCGASILSPAFWYLPLGVVFLYLLRLYIRSADEHFPDWFESPNLFESAAIGVSVVAGFAVICCERSSLRCRVLVVAALGFLASVLLIWADSLPECVFAAFLVALTTAEIALLRGYAREHASNGSRVVGLLVGFLTVMAILVVAI